MHALWVGLGGFVGAVLRWGMSSVVQRWTAGAFPWGTLAVNVLGCLALGWLHGAGAGRGVLSAESRSFVMVGLLGGFTTFSTFAWESFDPGRSLGFWGGALNVGAQVVLGMAAVVFGHWLGSR